jgi:hypothetical protein
MTRQDETWVHEMGDSQDYRGFVSPTYEYDLQRCSLIC